MRKFYLALIVLCACSSSAQVADMSQYVPATAKTLSVGCNVASPQPADVAACLLYKQTAFNCALNLNAVGGVVNGALMAMAPLTNGVTAAAATGQAVAQPVIDAAQLTLCAQLGYITPAK